MGYIRTLQNDVLVLRQSPNFEAILRCLRFSVNNHFLWFLLQERNCDILQGVHVLQVSSLVCSAVVVAVLARANKASSRLGVEMGMELESAVASTVRVEEIVKPAIDDDSSVALNERVQLERSVQQEAD
jgi:hypothetical protein